MTQHSEEFYRAAIKTATPDAADIRRPAVSGIGAHVFLADVGPCKTRVYKFNTREIIHRNHVLSQTLALADVPTPRTTPHSYMGAYFESYEYCPDKTLCEHICNGMTDAQVFNVYRDAIHVQAKISKIKLDQIDLRTNQFFYQVASRNLGDRSRQWAARAYIKALATISRYGPQVFLHNDVHMGNILVDDNCNFTRLIDMDSIAFCNENYSVMQMLRAYPLDNVDELMDYYENEMGRKLNRNWIKSMVFALSAVRSPQKRVQMMMDNCRGNMR